MTASRSWLTGDDLIALSARIAAELDKVTGRPVSIAEDFNRCLSTAGDAIGRPAWDLNIAELHELADMVCDAIAGRVADRLEYLRGKIRAERISYGDLAELQGLAAHIAPGDVELLEWAGVPEFPADGAPMTARYPWGARVLCLDEPTGAHSWQNTGIDIVGDPPRCVYTARCVWCGKEAARKLQTDPPFRSSVRIAP